MNRWVVTLLFLGSAAPAGALDRHDGVAPIRPETPLEVALSSSDVNRITCNEPISDLIYSSEKGLEGQFTGNNAFIKFKMAPGEERDLCDQTDGALHRLWWECLHPDRHASADPPMSFS